VKFLRSLAVYGHLDGEVLLVDNASVDGTAEDACATGAGGLVLKVIRRKGRRPLPDNRNLGAKLSKGDIFLFCDSDIIFADPNFFETLKLDFARYNPDIVCPLILNMDDDRVQSAGVAHWGPSYVFRMCFHDLDKQNVPPMVFSVDMVHGACFAIKREAFGRLVGFDEMMAPFNFEEMDLAIRAKKSGMKMIADTRIYVRHLSMGTSGRVKRKLKGFYLVRHMFRSMIRNEGNRAYLMMPLYWLIVSGAAIFQRYGAPDFVLKAITWAVRNRSYPLKVSEPKDYEVVCER